MDRPDAGGVPVIDVAPLVTGGGGKAAAAAEIDRACREHGFFYVVGHGVDEVLARRLEDFSRRFFAQDEPTKLQIRMPLGGRAWRGYFPVGGELTSGKPDVKEGVYFGAELSPEHPLVRSGVPLHGPNLFPGLPGFREAVLAYLDALTALGHALAAGIALGLGLPETYFRDRYTADPLVLFRIFNYPAGRRDASGETRWGVGEHTDYGFLTILRQDDVGGLQVKTRGGWLDAPPIPGSLVCNIGDMLDRMTGGLYRSTPHRVLNAAGRDRLSFPFFFDPSFEAAVRPIAGLGRAADDRDGRWDKASVHAFEGTYGDYLLAKVGKVFPQLRSAVL